jgi:WhiB family redox-sensing transcriptional regulator
MAPGAPDLEDLLARPEWFARAACRGKDPNLFVPPFSSAGARAKAVCSACAVVDACLDYALRRPDLSGVWGGKTERERNRLRGHRS